MATHDPWDGTKWDITSPDIDQPYGNAYKEIYDLRKGIAIRMNKEHETLATSSAGGVHKQGSARAFFQDAAPGTQVDGSAFDSGDLGSFWVDSNSTIDNELSILTATTPTWTPVSTNIIATLLASNRQFAGTLTVDGASTLTGAVGCAASITLGAGADLIGSSTSDITINTNKFTVAGATGNTLVAGTLDVQGNIDPTTYETTNGGFLDEDDMASDAADKVASQQSIKAYTDAHGTVQVVNTQTGAVNTGTTIIPYDDTIPQITEGDEYMTLAITPTSANNKLKIEVVGHFAHSTIRPAFAIALFQDTTANALAAMCAGSNYSAGQDMPICFTHYMTAGTTSETTFRVRAGASAAGTTTFNGAGGARKLGGVMASSITITEIKV